MKVQTHAVAAGATLLLTISPALGQYVLYAVDGDTSADEFGESVDFLGDIDGDGAADFVVGGGQELSPGDDVGYVRVYSGQTGALIREHLGTDSTSRLGQAVADAGDVNDDGVGDYMAGAPGAAASAGEVFVWSGVDGAVLLHLVSPAPDPGTFGHSLASTGDLNGDGHDDLIIGAPFANTVGIDNGAAFVFSGSDGALMFSMVGFPFTIRFGQMVTGLGDVNSDGTPDLLVGNARDYARVYSGADGSPLHFLVPPSGDTDWFAFSADNAGDVDGDGVDDFAIGAPGNGMDQVFLYSGATCVLFRAYAVPGRNFGWSVHNAGDVNGDLVPDLIIGAPAAFDDPGSAYVYSGTDGVELFRLDGAGDGEMFGSAVSGGADATADGVLDLLVGAKQRTSQPAGTGRAFLYSGGSCPVTSYCEAKVTSNFCLPFVRSEGCPSVTGSDDFHLVAGDVREDSFGVFFWGHGAATVPFAGGTLCVESPVTRTDIVFSGGIDGSFVNCTGAYELHFTQAYMASEGVRAGEALFGQYWFRDSGFAAPDNVGMTEGIQFVIQP